MRIGEKTWPKTVSEKELLVISREQINDNYESEVVRMKTVTRDNIKMSFFIGICFINQYVLLPPEFDEI